MRKQFHRRIVHVLLSALFFVSCVSLSEETKVPAGKPASFEENSSGRETSPPTIIADEEIEYILPTYYIATKDRDRKLGSITLALIFDRYEYPAGELRTKIELINREINSHFSTLKYSDIDTRDKIEKNTESVLEKINLIFETGRVKKIKIIEMNIE
jgi:hypothetical protein